MKNLILTLFCLLLFNSSFAQDFSSKSKAELNVLKQEAVAAENYSLASKIKKELETRVSIDEIIATKNIELQTAVASEDYGKAEQLNKEITTLKAKKAKIDELKIEKQIAINSEDYEKVVAIEKEIKILNNRKKPYKHPLTIEQEIDFIINYYQTKINEEFSIANYDLLLNVMYGVKPSREEEQRMRNKHQQKIDDYRKRKERYIDVIKNRVDELSDKEKEGIFSVFLSCLNLSKKESIKEKYRQYFLSKVTRQTPFSLKEKLETRINHYESAKISYPEIMPLPSYDSSDELLTELNKWLIRINSLSLDEINSVNILFYKTPLTEKSAEINEVRVIKFFE
jgi:hypothetical protein